MTDEIQIEPEQIHIRGIKILGGSITSEFENLQIEKIIGFNVQYGIKDELNYDDKVFRFIFSVNLEALGPDNNPLGVNAQYVIEYIFFVENLNYYVTSIDHENKNMILHPVLPNTLLSIVYSTSRGIILSRTQGTVIEGVILPVINTNSLIRSLEDQKLQQTETSI